MYRPRVKFKKGKGNKSKRPSSIMINVGLCRLLDACPLRGVLQFFSFRTHTCVLLRRLGDFSEENAKRMQCARAFQPTPQPNPANGEKGTCCVLARMAAGWRVRSECPCAAAAALAVCHIRSRRPNRPPPPTPVKRTHSHSKAAEQMGKKRFYAVCYPFKALYTHWNDCERDIRGVSRARFKGFESKEAANVSLVVRVWACRMPRA